MQSQAKQAETLCQVIRHLTGLNCSDFEESLDLHHLNVALSIAHGYQENQAHWVTSEHLGILGQQVKLA